MPTSSDENREPSSRDERSEVAVLIPAAGRGVRLGGRRKQFRRLGEALLLVQTVRVFAQHPEVHRLVIAAPNGEEEAVEAMLHGAGLEERVAVVPGGASRQASVHAALVAAPAGAGIVLVHDAVRPFVAPELVTVVIEAVRAHGAAAPALPVADTLRHGAGDTFGDTISRRGLYRMQTPQGFRRDWLEAAHEAAADDHRPATDDVELVRRLGYDVHIVEGRPRNFKITTPADWELAQALCAVSGFEFGVSNSRTRHEQSD